MNLLRNKQSTQVGGGIKITYLKGIQKGEKKNPNKDLFSKTAS